MNNCPFDQPSWLNTRELGSILLPFSVKCCKGWERTQGWTEAKMCTHVPKPSSGRLMVYRWPHLKSPSSWRCPWATRADRGTHLMTWAAALLLPRPAPRSWLGTWPQDFDWSCKMDKAHHLLKVTGEPEQQEVSFHHLSKKKTKVLKGHLGLQGQTALKRSWGAPFHSSWFRCEQPCMQQLQQELLPLSHHILLDPVRQPCTSQGSLYSRGRFSTTRTRGVSGRCQVWDWTEKMAL